MRVDDRFDQARETALDLGAARGVLHFNAATLTADQAGVAQGREMLGEGRLRNVPVDYRQEVGATLRALRVRDLRKDRDAHRVGEGVEDRFDGHVLDRRMKKRPHDFLMVSQFDSCSIVRKFGTIDNNSGDRPYLRWPGS